MLQTIFFVVFFLFLYPFFRLPRQDLFRDVLVIAVAATAPIRVFFVGGHVVARQCPFHTYHRIKLDTFFWYGWWRLLLLLHSNGTRTTGGNGFRSSGRGPSAVVDFHIGNVDGLLVRMFLVRMLLLLLLLLFMVMWQLEVGLLQQVVHDLLPFPSLQRWCVVNLVFPGRDGNL